MASSSSKGKGKLQYTQDEEDEFWDNFIFYVEAWKEKTNRKLNEEANFTPISEDKSVKKKKSKKQKPVLIWESLDKDIKKWIAKNSNKDTDSMYVSDSATEILEPTGDLIVPLLKFQKEWLAWAVNQEKSVFKGGILADEMGMGKTIQAIALVLYKRKHPCDTPIPSVEQKLQPVKATLVICPRAAVSQWEQEIEKSTSKGSVNVVVYHDSERELEAFQQYLSECDFLITTYGVVSSEYKESQKPIAESRVSKLHSVMWHRIILDEAHYIKDAKNQRTRAVLDLHSTYKWGLSGTLVQNKVGDLYSVVRFLRLIPYSCYFCTECDCNTVERDFKDCTKCGHHQYFHFRWWHKYVSKPIQIGGTKVMSCRDAMIFLKHNVLKSIMLRRTKEDRAAELGLPPKVVTLRMDSLDKVEDKYYEAELKRIWKMKESVKEWAMTNYFPHAMNTITRVRQALNHPYLVEFSSNPKSCGICGANENTSAISCGHYFCQPCSTQVPTSGCFSCLNILSFDYSEDFKEKRSKSKNIVDSIKLSQFRTSTKIEALREEIRFMLEKDGSAKGIVFSQFSPFLDLINYALNESGMKTVLLRGHMTPAARKAAIKRFREEPDCTIFLTTFKAGGVALNLPVASHVFLMEPCYNPTVEWQAQDRVHRIGQHKPVRVVRFIMKNTIEERILELQKNKKLLFEGTMKGCSEVLDELEKMEMNAIWPLFSI